MILPALLRTVGWAIGVVQGAGELAGAGKRLLQQAKRGLLPLDDTDPTPLSHKDAERIAEFGRRAGHESQTFPKPRR